MLHPFISARRSGLGNPGLLTASIATHVGLVALAIAWPQRPFPAALSFARAVAEHVTYAFTEPLVDRLAESAERGGRGRLAAHHRQQETRPDPYAGLASLQVSFPATIPEPNAMSDYDFGAVARHVTYSGGEVGEFDRGVLGRGVPAPNYDGAYTEDLVEKSVMPYNDNPRPRYPVWLQERRVQDAFDVLFVVDSTGRVVEHSIRVLGRTERMLVEAVRYALKRSRYFPAEVGGHRVPQLVEQRFIFRIEDR